MSKIKLQDSSLQEINAKKPHLAFELKDWIGVIQHTTRTASLDCKYFVEVDLKYQGLLVKDMAPVIVPINVYYHNNVFFDPPKQVANTYPMNPIGNPYSAPPKPLPPLVPPQAAPVQQAYPDQIPYYPQFNLSQPPAGQPAYNFAAGDFYGEPNALPQFSYEYEDIGANPQDTIVHP